MGSAADQVELAISVEITRLYHSHWAVNFPGLGESSIAVSQEHLDVVGNIGCGNIQNSILVVVSLHQKAGKSRPSLTKKAKRRPQAERAVAVAKTDG